MFTEKEDTSRSIARKTEDLSIKFSLLGLTATLIYVLLFIIIEQFIQASACLLLAGMMGWAYYSNRKGKIDPWRIITLFVLNVTVFAIDLTLGRHSGLFLLFIPLMGAAFVLFNSKEYIRVWLMIATSLLCIFILEFTNHELFLSHEKLEPWKNYTIFYTSLIISMAAVAYIIYELRETNYAYEKELRQQKSFFENVFDEMPTDLVVFNGLREYVYLNPAAVKDSEMRKWMIGKTETQYMTFRKKPPEFVRIRDHAFDEVLATKKVVEFEEAITDRQGKTHHFIRRMHPVLSEQEEIRFVIGYGLEITPQKEAQISLMHSKLLAEQTAKAKSNFLSNISHEIRTPLNAILGMSDLLIHDPAVNLQENLFIIKESADNLLALIDDILDLSRFDEGKIVLESKPFQMRTFMQELIEKTTNEANSKTISFESDFDTNIPDQLTGDRNRLRQILTNITGNAVKFTERGKITFKAQITEIKPGWIEIDFIVSDTGIGIAPGKKEVIFESFTQADAYTTRKYGGSGLGLNLSRKLCEMMGGSISVESIQGKGSTFSVKVPFMISDAIKIKELPVEGKIKAEHADADFIECRVLMAEDNIVNQKLAVQLFKKWGVELDLAQNGVEALNKVRKKVYDIILMDLQMPEMDGITALKKIRSGEAGEQNKHLVVIALTADVFEDSRRKADEAGFDEFITKPYSNTELMKKMMACKNRKK